MRNLLLMTTLIAAPLSAETLNIYTYDSFASEWGPGPAIEKGFEAQCDCDLVFTAAGDGASILSRLQLEGENTEADIVVGIDQNLSEKASETNLFEEHGFDASQNIGSSGLVWDNEVFRAYDWGHFAFVYKKENLETPPKTLKELAESDLKVVIQDPRSSTPGLGLAVWVAEVYGDDAAKYWDELKDNIVTVTPGWSEAYSLFLADEADMVLSYTSSPAYHLIVESDDGFAAASFEDGHAMQIELAGILASSEQKELGQAFLEYLESDEAQNALVTGNWMYPVSEIAVPEGFADQDEYVSLETSRSKSDIEAAKASFEEGMK